MIAQDREPGGTGVSARALSNALRGQGRPRHYLFGFTLVEVLAALMLIVIVLPVAMRGISLATQMAGKAKQREEAAVLAESKLNEVVATRVWQAGTLNGAFDDFPDYRWTAELIDWDDSTLKELDVHVLWKVGGVDQQVTLSTLLDTNTN